MMHGLVLVLMVFMFYNKNVYSVLLSIGNLIILGASISSSAEQQGHIHIDPSKLTSHNFSIQQGAFITSLVLQF